jgi:hypothetical protein
MAGRLLEADALCDLYIFNLYVTVYVYIMSTDVYYIYIHTRAIY